VFFFSYGFFMMVLWRWWRWRTRE